MPPNMNDKIKQYYWFVEIMISFILLFKSLYSKSTSYPIISLKIIINERNDDIALYV